MRRGAVAAALVGTALVLSGCQYLLGPLTGDPMLPGDPGAFGSFDPNGPAFPLPSAEATYTKGSAVVTIDGETLHLDRLSGPGGMNVELGTDVGWTDGNGNYLHLFGAGVPGGPGFLSIDRIADGQHLGIDPMGCAPKMTKSGATGISGSATCKGLHWIDVMGYSGGFAAPSAGPAFDAEITFEATP